jgi:hypothetical protein
LQFETGKSTYQCRILYPACDSSTVSISPNETGQKMSASSARSEIFIEKSLPLSPSGSVSSGIDFRFAMSLLTELEESKGGRLAIKILLLAELVASQACQLKTNA